jgi:hypothetical protein
MCWYWISYIWVEAEPAAPGIQPPEGREYFHRYKVRFDWVQSQGWPWWDTFAHECEGDGVDADEDGDQDDGVGQYGPVYQDGAVNQDGAVVRDRAVVQDKAVTRGGASKQDERVVQEETSGQNAEADQEESEEFDEMSVCSKVVEGPHARSECISGLLTPPITPAKDVSMLKSVCDVIDAVASPGDDSVAGSPGQEGDESCESEKPVFPGDGTLSQPIVIASNEDCKDVWSV